MVSISSISNIVNMIYRVRGGAAVAQESRLVANGIGGIGRSVNQATEMSSRFNSQWRAIGTTLRYAIAGGVVFGLARMVSQLKDVQQQMGLISAIGQKPGGQSFTGGDLNKILDANRKGALDALTPLTDYNDAVINFLSTVQNVPRDQISPMVTTIARAAKLGQISAEDATKAFTTMNVAFGMPVNQQNVHRMAEEFFILTKEAPGGVSAGQQVIGQLGQLAQVTRAAHGTPEDMFSLLLSTLRTGIPPSQAGRGLQFLIQTLAFPGQQAKDSQQALSAVGITPTTNMSLQQRLGRVFGRARSLGVTGDLSRLTRMDDESFADLEASGQSTTQSLSSLGISGRGAQYLGTVFHRIHALRTAIALEGQVNVGQAQQDFQYMTDSANGHVSDVHNLNKAWDRFHKQARLQEAVIALDVMRVQVAQAFAPLLNLGAGVITGGAHAAMHHGKAVQIASLGLAGIAGVVGLRRFLGFGGGNTVARAEAFRDIGHAGLGASPEHPMYVVVVGQLFNPKSTLPPGLGIPNKDIRESEKVAERVRRAKKFGGRAALFGTVGAIAAGAYLDFTHDGRQILYMPADKFAGAMFGYDPRAKAGGQLQQMYQFPRIMQFFEAMRTPGIGAVNPRWSNLFRQFETGQISASKFDKMLARADVYMEIDVNQNGRVTTKRVHIPADFVPYSGGRTPSTRGKKAVRNG